MTNSNTARTKTETKSKMNYIHQLQADLAGHIAAVESYKASIAHIRAFLHSDKFTGVETDGERKDWIATGDLLSMLWAMESNALDAGDSAKANWKPATTIQ